MTRTASVTGVTLSPELEFETPVIMSVYQDTETDEKVIQFYTSEDHTVYLNSYYYSGTTLTHTEKKEIGGEAQEDWHDF